jgi:hypothetical protein
MNVILYSTPDTQQGWNFAYRGPGYLFGHDIT